MGKIEKITLSTGLIFVLAVLAAIFWGREKIQDDDLIRGRRMIAVQLMEGRDAPSCIASALGMDRQQGDRIWRRIATKPAKWRRFNSARHIWAEITPQKSALMLEVFSRDGKPLREIEQARLSSCLT